MNNSQSNTGADSGGPLSLPRSWPAYIVADASFIVLQSLASLLNPEALLKLPLTQTANLHQIITSRDTSGVQAVLINIHLPLFAGTRSSDFLGLRLFDEIILSLGEYCPPLVMYSPLKAEHLTRLCQQQTYTTSTPWLEVASRLHESGGQIEYFVVPLPIRPDDLAPTLLRCQQLWKQLDLHTLQSITALAYVEHTHAQVRHSFDNLRRPTARLLLGSELREQSLRHNARTRQALQNVAQKMPQGRRLKDPLLPLKSEIYQRLLSFAPPQLEAVLFEDKLRILLIDDMCEESGWAIALKALFPRCTVEAVDSPQTIRESPNNFDLILLDYDLVNGGTTGRWLRSTKAQYPELPIIMFTLSDRMDIARWCLQHGANVYFVKEPYELAQRNSAEHLGRLLAVLHKVEGPHQPSKMTGMWIREHSCRRFINVLFRENWNSVSEAERAISGLVDASLSWHLAQLGRTLLTNYSDFYVARTSTLVSGNRLFEVAIARLVYHAEVALEMFAAYWWQKYPHPDPSIQAKFSTLKGGWQKQWRYLMDNRYRNLPLYPADLNSRNDGQASHWKAFLPEGSPSAPERIFKILSGPLTKCLKRLPRPSTNAETVSFFQYEVPSLEPEPQPVPSLSGWGPKTHAEHQILGAKELIEGFREVCQCRIEGCAAFIQQLHAWSQQHQEVREDTLLKWIDEELQPDPAGLAILRNRFPFPQDSLTRILILDDQPSSPFVTALRTLLLAICRTGQIQCFVKHPSEIAPEEMALRKFEMVLLDLDHGTSHRPQGDDQGLQWLTALRTTGSDWGTPVALVSARIDSLSLEEVYQRGAIDYIPKRVSGRDYEGCMCYILKHIMDITRIAWDVRRLRSIERRIRTDVWENPLTFAGHSNKSQRLANILECQSPATLIERTQAAVTEALLSAWCNTYLNVAGSLRPDAWLDTLFSNARPDELHLGQAIVDMGCAVEPLILMCRHLDTALYKVSKKPYKNRSAPVSAGDVTRFQGGWISFSSLLGRPLAEDLRRYWNQRNDCEHGKGLPEGCDPIELLNNCVTTVIQFRKTVAQIRPW